MFKPTLASIGFAVALTLTSMHLAIAQEVPTTSPTSIADSLKLDETTAPATEPAVVVLDGYLAPVDPFEAKLKLKQFAGPLKVKQVVPYASAVKQGDTLIEFDTADIDEAIVAATSELELARARLAKQQVDNTIGEQGDALALEIATDAVADAQLALDWWTKNDAPGFLKRLELQLKNSEHAVGDQEDELDQLKKMYKSEELTNATADIVVKRAVRQLEQSKLLLDLTRGDLDRQKATEYVDRQQQVERSLLGAKQSLEALKAQQSLSKVERDSAMLAAKTAHKAAERKLNELEEDKAAMTVKSKIDGVTMYGSFANGAWGASESDAIRVDEKIDVSATFLTVFTPGKMKAIAGVDEAKVLSMTTGTAVVVKPTAIEGASIDGKTLAVAPLAGPDGLFKQVVELADVDKRLVPGMKVKIEIQEGK